MNKAKVCIQFTSLTNLWAFRNAIDINIFEMNLKQLTISCYCTKQEVELAVKEFRGQVVEIEEIA